jgi:hypothetical protein
VMMGGGGGGGRGAPAPAGGASPSARVTSTTSAPASSSRRAPATTPSGAPAGPSSTSLRSTSSTAPSPVTTETAGRGPRAVDFAEGFTYPRDECGDDPQITEGMTVRGGRFRLDGIDRLSVDGVQYGDVLGDGGDEAVVTISCLGASRITHAVVYTADSSGPGGVRRVAVVEPDHATGTQLGQQGIVSWRLGGVSIDAGTVVSDWVGYRAADPAAGPGTSFTVRQRWTPSGWEAAGPLVVTAAVGR